MLTEFNEKRRSVDYCGQTFYLAPSCVHKNSIFYITESTEKHREKVKVFEVETIEKFNELISEDMRILDIGANYGAFSLLAKLHPKTSWLSFEPNLDVYRKLVFNLQLNEVSNVTPLPFAVGANMAFKTLHVPTNHVGLSTLSPRNGRFDYSKSSKHQVPVVALDSFIGSSKVDLVKVDIEGGEYNAFKGMQSILEKQRPILFFEFVEANLKTFKTSKSRLEKLLKKFRYEIAFHLEGDVIATPIEKR